MKIVILDGNAVNPGDLSWDFLQKFGTVTVYDRTPEELISRHIGDAEIVLLNKAPITQAVLDACPNIRLICVLATGYNVVDMEATRAKGITVCNVPSYSTAAVAQFTFALILELCHQIGLHSQSVHGGVWTSCPDFCYWNTPQLELAGKTLGIIGYGRIGNAVAAIAKAFGMDVLVFSRSKKPGVTYTELDALMQKADIVTLHCPLTADTNQLINASTLAKMKPGAFLINTSRGPVLDEQAVADALCSGHLGGAAVDVASVEPIQSDSPLLTAPNCIITPHMAWAPITCRQRIMDTTRDSIRGYLSGHAVNTV